MCYVVTDLQRLLEEDRCQGFDGRRGKRGILYERPVRNRRVVHILADHDTALRIRS